MQAAFLFELAIKATVVVAATAALARMLSRASAAARSAVWAAGLTFAVMLPLFMSAAPPWSVGLLPSSPIRRAVGTLVSDSSVDDPGERVALRQSSPAARAAGVPSARNFPEASRAVALAWPAIVILWLLGTGVALIRLVQGLLAVRGLARTAEPFADEAWRGIVADGCAQLGVRRPPAVRISSRIDVPALCGVIRPTLLLPLDCSAWSDSCRRVVVLHELAHLRRRDCLIQLLADCASAMYWFHPLVRRAIGHLRHEREQACDDVVIEAGTSPATYADHLLDLVRAGIAVPPAPAVAFGAPSRLNQRISAILDDDRCRTTPSGRRVAVAVLAGSVGVAALGGLTVLAQAASSAHAGDHGGGVVTRTITADTRQRVKDALAAAMRDSNDDVRRVAVATLEAIQAGGDAPLRVETPCGGNCVNWETALEPVQQAILRLADESELVRLMSDDVDVRRAAVGRVWPRTQRGAAALAQALLDNDRIVRNGAAIRLDSVHAPLAVPNWIVLLGDTDPMLRERAAISLGVIGDPRAIDPLGETLRDLEAAVRLQAARALASIALGRSTASGMPGAAAQERRFYRQEDGVTLPETVRGPKPEYTPEALQARLQGLVRLKAIVEADGTVKDVDVVQSLDTEYGLDNQAVAAIKRWEFKPGLWMGVAVPVQVTVDMRFTLR